MSDLRKTWRSRDERTPSDRERILEILNAVGVPFKTPKQVAELPGQIQGIRTDIVHALNHGYMNGYVSVRLQTWYSTGAQGYIAEHGIPSLDPSYEVKMLKFGAMHGNVTAVGIAIVRRVDLETRFEGGQTAMHLAAHNGHARVVEQLYTAGADPFARDDKRCTPFKYVDRKLHPKTTAFFLEVLLKRGAQENDLDLIRGAIKQHVSLNAGERIRETALHVAARLGHLNATNELLRAGANPFAINKEHQTPLDAMDTADHPRTAGVLRRAMGLEPEPRLER